MSDDVEVQAFASAMVEKYRREVGQMKTASGLLVAHRGSTPGNWSLYEARIDGDPHTTPVVVAGVAPAIGSRVTVMFAPPAGALVLGSQRAVPTSSAGCQTVHDILEQFFGVPTVEPILELTLDVPNWPAFASNTAIQWQMTALDGDFSSGDIRVVGTLYGDGMVLTEVGTGDPAIDVTFGGAPFTVVGSTVVDGDYDEVRMTLESSVFVSGRLEMQITCSESPPGFIA